MATFSFSLSLSLTEALRVFTVNTAGTALCTQFKHNVHISSVRLDKQGRTSFFPAVSE